MKPLASSCLPEPLVETAKGMVNGISLAPYDSCGQLKLERSLTHQLLYTSSGRHGITVGMESAPRSLSDIAGHKTSRLQCVRKMDARLTLIDPN
jgi:hypothetical protein